MFDPKKLLEAMLGGGQPAARPQAQGTGGGDLGDLLGQILGGGQGGQQGGQAAPGGGAGGGIGDILRRLGEGSGGGAQRHAVDDRGPPPPQGGQGGGLDDLLRRIGGGADRGGAPQHQEQAAPPAGGGGGLGDLLEQLQRHMGRGGGTTDGQGGAPGAGQGGGASGSGGIADILGQILGQATSGAREGAGRIGEATGAREALEKATGGRSADDLLGQLKNWVNENQLAAGAAAGGAGAVILGTQTGRRLAGTAAKLGALALIGGLAYKAYQNYSQGRPVLAGQQQLIDPAPQGSGFEPQALTGDQALLFIKAMIAAAAADGRIDADEQARILGSLKQAGVEQEAAQFLELEIQNPTSPEDLASAVKSGEDAVQVYAAARIAIDADTAEESDFLAALARALNLEPALVQHMDGLVGGRA